MTRSSGHSAPFLLAPAEGWGALQAPCYGAYGPIAMELYISLKHSRNMPIPALRKYLPHALSLTEVHCCVPLIVQLYYNSH